MSAGPYWQSVGRRTVLRASITGAAGWSAAALAACGGSGRSPESPGASGVGAPGATPATAVDVGKTGGVLQVALLLDPPSTDPFKHISYASQLNAGYPYSKLLKFRTGPGVVPSEFEITSDLAESWQVADPLTYTFKLRPGVRFHDIAPVSGRPLEASDISYSISRFLSISAYKGNLSPVIDKVETPDATTVTVKLKEPDADFLTKMADSLTNAVWVFPKEADSYDTIKTVIGTGAWLFDGLQPSIAVSYKRNPNYFLKDAQGRQLPYMDGVKGLVIPEYSQRLAQFQAGNVHIGAETVVKAPDIKAVRQALPNAELYPTDVSLTFQIFAFRPLGPGSSSPFNDVRVRRAVSMAIDRDGLINTLSEDGFYAAEGLKVDKRWHNAFSAGLSRWWLDPKAGMQKGEEWAKWYKYDVAEAKKLMTAAGYPDGFEAEYHRTVKGYGDTYDDAAEAFVPMLSAIGIKPKVLVHDYSSKFIPDIYSKGDYRGLGNLLQSFNVPGLAAFALYHPDGQFNRNKWNEPALIDLIDKQKTELDIEKRRALVHEYQRFVSNDMHNVPLVVRSWSSWTVSWPFVKNWQSYRTPSNSFASGSESHLHWWLDK